LFKVTLARRLIALVSALCLLPLLAIAATSTASASGPPAADDPLFTPLEDLDLGKSQDVRVRPAPASKKPKTKLSGGQITVT
jgi:hypothetical protein